MKKNCLLINVFKGFMTDVGVAMRNAYKIPIA